MASLWEDLSATNNKKIQPSPTNQKSNPNSAQNSGKNSIKLNIENGRPIKERLPNISRLTDSGSMTVEACIVLPICIFFLLNLSYAIEMIRLHNALQMGMWNAGNNLAVTTCGQDRNVIVSLLSDAYFKEKALDFCGEDYLRNSPLQDGKAGIKAIETGTLLGEDELDMTFVYRVEPFSSVVGFASFTMKNRFVMHLWNGYSIPDEVSEDRCFFVTKYGEVCHNDRNCSYLVISVREVSFSWLSTHRNSSGHIYGACGWCANGTPGDTVYITEDGTNYHFVDNCPGLNRTIWAVTAEEAMLYRPCSRCGNGKQ